MLVLAAEALKTAGKAVQSAFFDRIRTYVNYVKNCDKNLMTLLEELEKFLVEKGDFDDQVLGAKEKSEKLTGKAARWLAQVRDLTRDNKMKKIMNKDMGIAKVMLRLVKDDLKKLVEEDGEMCDLVLKVMKDVTKRKRNAGDGQVSDAEEKDKEVCQVLEKLIAETMVDFKTLMQNDMNMAVAALHLLENHMENLERLMEKDKDVAVIIAEAREMSLEEESLSDDDHNNVLARENALREKVTNLLKPVREVIQNKEFLKALPENVRLGMDVLGVVMGGGLGLKADLTDADNTASHIDCCCCVISYNCFSDRHDMSVAAEAMLGKIKDIVADKPKNGDVTRPMRRGEMEGVPTYSVGLKSRKKLLRKIMKALTSDDVNALGVFGMGGSGKTTLAKEVADSKANGIFKIIAMVEISESPNIEYIQDQIGDGLGLDMHKVHGISEKATVIYNRLKQEQNPAGGKDNNSIKTLIILDNIWTKIDLGQIGIHREYCKVLVTSREKKVCKEMDVQSDNIFEVGLLNNDEAKVLFKFQVQKDIHTGEHKSIVDRLLEKCGGLPLSIVTTANSLKGRELPLWRQFVEELEKPISCQISGVHHETFSILRTSYEVMTSKEKKKFFLLACLSPIGSSISIDNLMRYGIGLGLFQNVNKLSEAIKQAYTWAEELVSSSMLLKGDSEEKVKVHDVVRESTMSFASKLDPNKDKLMFLVDAIPRWIFKETFNEYTGISLLSRTNYSRLNGVKAELLQILLLKGYNNHSSILESNFFQGMTNLKVLEVLFMNFREGLPESMSKLKDLKTLHLINCKLGDINLIGELESLIVLSLCGSTLETLADEIGKLKNLRLLDLSNCQCEQPRVPTNVISKLFLLEGLYLVGSSFTEWAATGSTSSDIGAISGAGIDELNKLKFLNVLEIRILEPKSYPICALFVENLDNFKIIFGQEDFKNQQPSQCALMVSKFDISEELKSRNCLRNLLWRADFLALNSVTFKNIIPELDNEGHTYLRYLELCRINRIYEGKALRELFLNLRHLEVSNLKNVKELLPVNLLPHNLATLEISNCNSLTYIFGEYGGPPAYEGDGVNNEYDIIELRFLTKLDLSSVSSLISLVKHSSIDDSRHQGFFHSEVKMPSLENLILFKNENIVELWGKESNIHSFQNLKVLDISWMKEMQTIGPPSIFHALVQLETLKISRCNKMQRVISKESDRQEIPEEIISFPKLKCLQISSPESFDFSDDAPVSLGNIQCFYEGSYKLKFPCLETLDFSLLEHMRKFAEGENSASFFSDKIEFPRLDKILFVSLLNITVLWDLEERMTEGEGEEIRSNLVPNLETLSLRPSVAPGLRELLLGQCHGLQWIVAGEPNQVAELPSLEIIQIAECDALKSLSTIPLKAPKLRKIEVVECPKLEWFLLGNTNCGEDLELTLPSLEDVTIRKCPNMKSFSPAILRAPRLRELYVAECNEWEWLFDEEPNQVVELPSLENVTIGACDAMKSFSTGPLKAPKLRELKVSYCPEMVWFLLGNSNCNTDLELQLPSLEDVTIWKCPNMKSFSPAILRSPKLRELYVAECNEWEWLFDGETNQVVELPSLENVTIETCRTMKSFSTRPLKAPKLRELKVSYCPEMVWFLLGNSNCNADLELPSLKNVTITKCPNMKSFSPAILRSPRLRELYVAECNEWEWLFNGEPNQVLELPSLENVTIEACGSMKSLSARPLKAPKLRELTISKCREMVWFLLGNSNCNADLELPSLENVTIKRCLNMKSFPPAILRAPRLRELYVAECNKWEWLFDGEPNQVVELPSLEKVVIRGCKAMKSFSTRPLKAPKLRGLRISNCPEMEWFILGNSNCNTDMELPSLENVTIKICPNMKSFPPAILRAPKLRELSVAECNKWERLFDGEPNQVLELPSLEEVIIDDCDAVKSFSIRPLKAPKLRNLMVSNCPKMECFLLGNSNCYVDLDLELPSLENVTIEKCPDMKSFSPAALRAPKLKFVEVNDKPYSIADIEDLNHVLQSANSSE